MLPAQSFVDAIKIGSYNRVQKAEGKLRNAIPLGRLSSDRSVIFTRRFPELGPARALIDSRSALHGEQVQSDLQRS